MVFSLRCAFIEYSSHLFAVPNPVVTAPLVGGEAVVSQQDVKYDISGPSQSAQPKDQMGLFPMLNITPQIVSKMNIDITFERIIIVVPPLS